MWLKMFTHWSLSPIPDIDFCTGGGQADSLALVSELSVRLGAFNIEQAGVLLPPLNTHTVARTLPAAGFGLPSFGRSAGTSTVPDPHPLAPAARKGRSLAGQRHSLTPFTRAKLLLQANTSPTSP